jgi:hypothetical protein
MAVDPPLNSLQKANPALRTVQYIAQNKEQLANTSTARRTEVRTTKEQKIFPPSIP